MSHRLGSHYGGWNPQRADQRDFEFVPAVPAQSVPPALSLDVTGIPVLDQAQQGSCTGHGVSGAVMFDQKQQGETIVVPSRAMVYYDARKIEGTTDQDAGAEVRDAVGGVAKYGVCPDTEFPYDDQVFNRAPSVQDYVDAKLQTAIQYETVRYGHLNQAIASGFPFVFGFTVYESFESSQVASDGVVPIPARGEQVLGGHCVWCLGYNAEYSSWVAPDGHTLPARTKRCRNSWGDSWGDHGDFYLPQWYFDSGQCSDFWVIRRVGQA